MKKSRYFLKDLLDIIANFTKTQEERELSTKMFLPNVVDPRDYFTRFKTRGQLIM